MDRDPHRVSSEPDGPPTRLSRREMLAVSAVGAAALYLGLDGRELARRNPHRGRVIVVGAGLAGLSAAWELERRGWEAVVLEARRRVGGRCHTLRGFEGGQTAEAGGEFIDTTHREMLRFARRFGLGLEDLRRGEDDYEDIVYVGGRLRTLGRFVDREAAREIDRFYASVRRLGRALDPDDPASAGGELDRRSVAELIDEVGIGGRARDILDRWIRDDYAIEPERLSLLFLLIESKVTSSTPESGVEAFRIKGGNDRLAAAFAGRLKQRPHLSARVTKVQVTSGGVRVVAAGEDFRGDHVVLAAALPGLRRIRFEPALPEALSEAIRRLQYGPATKTALQYDTRFWRRRGASGDTFTDLPFSTAWEATGRQRGRRGILLAYSSGEAGLATARTPSRARIGATARQLDRIYPGSRPRLGRAVTIAWSNSPFDSGAYSAFAPGQVSDFWTALRRSYDRLHLAGEHTARLSGYMEGAVESGLRAARRIDASEG